MQKLELFQLIVSSALFGIIWMVQLLQYPSFLDFEKSTFKQNMKHHQDRISILIVPLMLSELGLALWGVLKSASGYHVITLILIALIWIITFTIHVPIHASLMREGFSESKIKKLVLTNWSRTLLWTIKLFVVFSASINSL